MITQALYYKDNYLKNFETVVKECIEENGKIKLVLEETAFYPEGGGQPSDIGFINGIKVIKVEEHENKIYHIVESKIEAGQKVSCNIDFNYRFSNMQSHTAEHIVSGLICKKYNATNVGFHIGKDFVTMDFNISFTEQDLREIEQEANNAIYKNIEVKTNIYTKEEVKKLEYRSKKEINEDVRIVEIPGYDRCACCGVHVSKTGEIGIIKLLKFEKYKSGIRIYMLAGFEAVKDYTNKFEQINNISTLLSLKLDEVYSGVVNLTKEIEQLKKDKTVLKNKIYEQEISKLPVQENLIIENNDIDAKDLKNYCTKLKEKVTGIAGVINNGKFIIMSDSKDLKPILKNLKDTLNINGGGNSQMIQGQLNDEPQKLIKLFSK